MDTDQKVRFIILGGLIAILIAFVFTASKIKLFSVPASEKSAYTQVRIKDASVKVEIVSTEEDREMGLSGRDGIGKSEGMLFIFEEPQIPSFWMKDMKFPIDIVWIEANQVVDINEQVPVETGDNLTQYSPKAPVDRVLEVNSGWVSKNGINIGDMVTIK